MKFNRPNLVSLIAATAVLLSGLIGLTHTHSHVELTGNELAVPHHSHAHLGCDHEHGHAEHPTEPCDHDDSEDCQVCRLLADFDATTSTEVELVLDSMAEHVQSRSPILIVLEPTLRVRSRGPPVV